jgi:hypothetical protein
MQAIQETFAIDSLVRFRIFEGTLDGHLGRKMHDRARILCASFDERRIEDASLNETKSRLAQ